MADMELSVPEGWEHRKLGEVFVSRNDKSKQIKSSDYLESGVYPVIDQSEVFVCGYSDDATKVISTSLPFVVFGDHTRHTKFIDFPFVCGADGTQLVKPKGEFDNRFFYYLVLKASQLIGNHGYDRHFKHLKNFPTVFPQSAAEQRQIARILSKADEAISQTEQLIAKYRRLKTGLMQDLLTKGIDAHGNIRSEETHAFKDSPLGRIPVEWEIVPAGSLCQEIVVGIVVRPTQYYVPSGVPMLRSQNIRPQGIVMRDLVYMSPYNNDKLAKSKLQEGDVVSVRTGYPGTTAVVSKSVAGSNCIDLVISRVNKSVLNPHFLALWINSEFGKKQILNHQSGIAQQHFNVGQMKNLEIFKSEVAEQQRILNHLKIFEDNGLNLSQELAKLNSLKTGLMQDLLSGKVRVGQLIAETAVA